MTKAFLEEFLRDLFLKIEQNESQRLRIEEEAARAAEVFAARLREKEQELTLKGKIRELVEAELRKLEPAT